jgi:hypothetical protein
MKYSGEDKKALTFSKRNFLLRWLLVVASIPLSLLTSVDDASSQIRRLNGTYAANDGSQLLVESVPVNQGEKLTLILAGVEISVSRNNGAKSFVYSHKGCTLVIMPYLVGRKQAISVEASGRCVGSDAPFGSLNISYERQVDGAINEKVVQPDSPDDTSLSSSKTSSDLPCGGTYIFVRLDTKTFDPVLGEAVPTKANREFGKCFVVRCHMRYSWKASHFHAFYFRPED